MGMTRRQIDYWSEVLESTLFKTYFEYQKCSQSFNSFLLFVIDYWIVICNHEIHPYSIVYWTSWSQLCFINWVKNSVHKTQMAAPWIYLMRFAFHILIFLLLTKKTPFSVSATHLRLPHKLFTQNLCSSTPTNSSFNFLQQQKYTHICSS